ncbi:hypothetical protein RV10_GL002682 [Enterococcus pallens]|nr:hypothetical protein RV10_GL002682 [Enterococcus pallens]
MELDKIIEKYDERFPCFAIELGVAIPQKKRVLKSVKIDSYVFYFFNRGTFKIIRYTASFSRAKIS